MIFVIRFLNFLHGFTMITITEIIIDTITEIIKVITNQYFIILIMNRITNYFIQNLFINKFQYL